MKVAKSHLLSFWWLRTQTWHTQRQALACTHLYSLSWPRESTADSLPLFHRNHWERHTGIRTLKNLPRLSPHIVRLENTWSVNREANCPVGVHLPRLGWRGIWETEPKKGVWEKLRGEGRAHATGYRKHECAQQVPCHALDTGHVECA